MAHGRPRRTGSARLRQPSRTSTLRSRLVEEFLDHLLHVRRFQPDNADDALAIHNGVGRIMVNGPRLLRSNVRITCSGYSIPRAFATCPVLSWLRLEVHTPATSCPWSPYSFSNSLLCGMAARQDPHHVAWKSTTTTFPFISAEVIGLLIQSDTSSWGMGLPSSAACSARSPAVLSHVQLVGNSPARLDTANTSMTNKTSVNLDAPAVMANDFFIRCLLSCGLMVVPESRATYGSSVRL